MEDVAEKVNATSDRTSARSERSGVRGLDVEPSAKVRPPRVAESPVHLECRVRQIMSIGDGPIAANLVIGEVLLIHIDDRVLDRSGQVDPRKLRTIARLGGNYYCRSTDLFQMERPTFRRFSLP